MADSTPYEVWDRRKSLGVMRDIVPPFTFFLNNYYPSVITSDEEFIDFEKLPRFDKKRAPFVRPMASGKPIYTDSSTAYRFKPAYIKVKDAIDPLAPLVKRPGIDLSMLGEVKLSPNQRRDLLRTAMSVQHVNAIHRTWEWMAAKATIDAKITIEGEEYPAQQLDFRRAANQTVVKTTGTFWGDTGVSIFDDIQLYCDRMFNAPFGGFPSKMLIGAKVWAVMRNDAEFMKHMDVNIRDPRATVERGLISSEKIVKVGELLVGGASGASIEILLYRDTYEEDGVEVPFLDPTDIVLLSSPERLNGFQCYGMIIDPEANYGTLPIFPRNWWEKGDPTVEYLLHQSSPLMVPINPNATLKATVVADA